MYSIFINNVFIVYSSCDAPIHHATTYFNPIDTRRSLGFTQVAAVGKIKNYSRVVVLIQGLGGIKNGKSNHKKHTRRNESITTVGYVEA